MKLKKFCISNYKVFKNSFSIDFSTDSIVILTGRNNTGKSTFLEAINCFFKKETKTTTIPQDCYSNSTKEIIFEAIFESNESSIKFIKKYKDGGIPKFYDWFGNEIKASHPLREQFDRVYENKPFYITPSMSTDDIHDQIHTIYSQIIKNDLDRLDDISPEDSPPPTEVLEMKDEYAKIKELCPNF